MSCIMYAFKIDQIIASALPSKARLECHDGHGSVWLGALAQHYLWHSNGHMSSNSHCHHDSWTFEHCLFEQTVIR